MTVWCDYVHDTVRSRARPTHQAQTYLVERVTPWPYAELALFRPDLFSCSSDISFLKPLCKVGCLVVLTFPLSWFVMLRVTSDPFSIFFLSGTSKAVRCLFSLRRFLALLTKSWCPLLTLSLGEFFNSFFGRWIFYKIFPPPSIFTSFFYKNTIVKLIYLCWLRNKVYI